MRASARAEYGIRALIDLAQHYGQGPIQNHEIARRQGLPEPYLAHLMITLRHAGLVQSTRGASGGHMLARSPEHIAVGEAFLALEGSVAPPWLRVGEDAPASESVLQKIMEAVKAATEEVLNRVTLADIARSTRAPLARP